MSMVHNYTLFDKAATAPIWSRRWHRLNKQQPTRWLNSKEIKRGQYDFKTGPLRELLAFSIDPEPSDDEIEAILANESIATTMKRCHPQYLTMEEVLRCLYPKKKLTVSFDLRDCSHLISIMSRAFLEGRITNSQMWAVAKLHNVQVSSWVTVDDLTYRKMGNLQWSTLWKPIYAWQDEDACRPDESTNCLSVVQTRQFAAVVDRAYKENWKGLPSEDLSVEKPPTFRTHLQSVAFARSLARGVRRFSRPCIYRSLI